MTNEQLRSLKDSIEKERMNYIVLFKSKRIINLDSISEIFTEPGNGECVLYTLNGRNEIFRLDGISFEEFKDLIKYSILAEYNL